MKYWKMSFQTRSRRNLSDARIASGGTKRMVLIMGIVMPVSMATIQIIGKLGYTGLIKVIGSVLTENGKNNIPK